MTYEQLCAIPTVTEVEASFAAKVARIRQQFATDMTVATEVLASK